MVGRRSLFVVRGVLLLCVLFDDCCLQIVVCCVLYAVRVCGSFWFVVASRLCLCVVLCCVFVVVARCLVSLFVIRCCLVVGDVC